MYKLHWSSTQIFVDQDFTSTSRRGNFWFFFLEVGTKLLLKFHKTFHWPLHSVRRNGKTLNSIVTRSNIFLDFWWCFSVLFNLKCHEISQISNKKYLSNWHKKCGSKIYIEMAHYFVWRSNFLVVSFMS